MCFELLIECILHGNEKQKDLAFKIIEEFLIKQNESDEVE